MSAETVAAQTLIGAALDLVGAKAANETLSATDGADGLRRLNWMIGRWQTYDLLIQTTARTLEPIVASQATYTIGSSGSPSVSTTRPLKLDRIALYETANTLETHLEWLTDQRYESIANKAQTSTVPVAWNYKPTLPNGTVTVWPVPTSTSYQLAIYIPTLLSTFADLTTNYTLTAGTCEAIVYNLAARLATPYGKQIPPEVAAIAQNSLADLKRLNAPLIELGMDSAFAMHHGADYDINVDA